MILPASIPLLIVLMVPVLMTVGALGWLVGLLAATVLRRDRATSVWDGPLAVIGFLIVAAAAIVLHLGSDQLLPISVGLGCLGPVFHQLFEARQLPSA